MILIWKNDEILKEKISKNKVIGITADKLFSLILKMNCSILLNCFQWYKCKTMAEGLDDYPTPPKTIGQINILLIY